MQSVPGAVRRQHHPPPPASLHALNTAQSSADQQVPDGGHPLCQGFHHSPARASSLTPRRLRPQTPGLSWGDFQGTEWGTEGSRGHTPRIGASCRTVCTCRMCGLVESSDPKPTARPQAPAPRWSTLTLPLSRTPGRGAWAVGPRDPESVPHGDAADQWQSGGQNRLCLSLVVCFAG